MRSAPLSAASTPPRNPPTTQTPGSWRLPFASAPIAHRRGRGGHREDRSPSAQHGHRPSPAPARRGVGRRRKWSSTNSSRRSIPVKHRMLCAGTARARRSTSQPRLPEVDDPLPAQYPSLYHRPSSGRNLNLPPVGAAKSSAARPMAAESPESAEVRQCRKWMMRCRSSPRRGPRGYPATSRLSHPAPRNPAR